MKPTIRNLKFFRIINKVLKMTFRRPSRQFYPYLSCLLTRLQ
ncbi:hypothetical protein NEISICOT_02708 [Neisseria sicca ATCC 29256]|uniref:Uncharacterized protein n=1 Tax=Neisseria sicca ATCC 29256 TaxID=547045 RepID=C6M843_NEISI|nr:hypothetical protein NEISICOT_02708 [Neisseria sicca ATCC 29256]